MSKKKKVLIISGIIVGIIVIIIVVLLARGSYIDTYNSMGVSSQLWIKIDGDQEKEKLGSIEGYTIYVYHLDIKGSYFKTIHKKRIYLKDAIKEKKVSVYDWRRKALDVKKDKKQEILDFDNYEIVIEGNDCIIRLKE